MSEFHADLSCTDGIERFQLQKKIFYLLMKWNLLYENESRKFGGWNDASGGFIGYCSTIFMSSHTVLKTETEVQGRCYFARFFRARDFRFAVHNCQLIQHLHNLTAKLFPSSTSRYILQRLRLPVVE